MFHGIIESRDKNKFTAFPIGSQENIIPGSVKKSQKVIIGELLAFVYIFSLSTKEHKIFVCYSGNVKSKAKYISDW